MAWRVSRGGGVYRVKHKRGSRKKTFRTKRGAERAAKRR